MSVSGRLTRLANNEAAEQRRDEDHRAGGEELALELIQITPHRRPVLQQQQARRVRFHLRQGFGGQAGGRSNRKRTGDVLAGSEPLGADARSRLRQAAVRDERRHRVTLGAGQAARYQPLRRR